MIYNTTTTMIMLDIKVNIITFSVIYIYITLDIHVDPCLGKYTYINMLLI